MKKLVSKVFLFLTHEGTIIIFLSLILLSFSYGPLVRHYVSPPPEGKVFLGSIGFPPDFWGNIISYQQGRLGHWSNIQKITTTIETPEGFYLPKIEYRLLGQLSRIFPLINPIVFFHLCRFLLSIIFIVVCYKLISRVFDTKALRISAFALAFFGSGVGKISQLLIELWSPLGVFQRSAYYPHYLFPFIFVIMIIISLSKALSLKKLTWLGLACLLGFSTGFIHGVNNLVLFLTFPFYTLLLVYNSLKERKPLKEWGYKIIYLLIFVLISGLPLFYMLNLGEVFPWSLLNNNDLKFNLAGAINNYQFMIGIGPTLLLAIFGAFFILRRKNDLAWLIAPWSIIYLVGYFFIWKLIPYNSQRFLQNPFFIILGILSVVTIDQISSWLEKRAVLSKTKLIILFVLSILIVSFPALKKSLDINIDNFSWAGDYTYYTNKENLQAIRWLGEMTKEEEIVLANKVNAELIVALAGNFSYYTIHTTELENFNFLENTVREFYAGVWTDNKAKNFLEDQKIKYVFWAEEEKNMSGKKNLKYSFLEKIYENPKVTIYSLKSL